MSALLAAAAALAFVPGACAGPGIAYTPGVNCRVIEVDGHPRRFVAYVPRRRAARAPVVLMYHGSSGTGEQFLRISGWREQADATGLVAVFPTGLRYHVLDGERPHATKWNGFDLASQVDLTDKPPGYPADAPWPADDVGFSDAMWSSTA
jgi:poly(3-hydroxybutyrate) depolymerase